MVNPFELHPEDRSKMSGKKLSVLNISEIRKIVEEKMKKIKASQAPTWGYNQTHIESFFEDLVADLENAAGEKNDS